MVTLRALNKLKHAKLSKVLTKSKHFLIQKGRENQIHSIVFLQKCISLQVGPAKSSSP